jgi:hypothetical protein
VARVGEVFSGNYLKAEDLQGKAVRVRIESVTVEKLGEDTKPVLHFRGKDKTLALNKTNANIIAEVLGTDEMDDWEGRDIVLYPTKTEFQGKRVPCIRVEDKPLPTQRIAPAAPRTEPLPADDPAADDEDSIPF